jgi:hypothetical protein
MNTTQSQPHNEAVTTIMANQPVETSTHEALLANLNAGSITLLVLGILLVCLLVGTVHHRLDNAALQRLGPDDPTPKTKEQPAVQSPSSSTEMAQDEEKPLSKDDVRRLAADLIRATYERPDEDLDAREQLWRAFGNSSSTIEETLEVVIMAYAEDLADAVSREAHATSKREIDIARNLTTAAYLRQAAAELRQDSEAQ